MLVEEIPRKLHSNQSTIYFSSSVNVQARATPKMQEQGDENRNIKARPKVNYNLTELLNAQTQVNYNNGSVKGGAFKSSHQIQLERFISKRLADLSKETPNPSFEVPKNFTYSSIHKHKSAQDKKAVRLGNTPSTKRILAARRNLNSYFEEEKNLISINTILGVNYSFAEQNDDLNGSGKRRKVCAQSKPKARLCCVCGSQSHYSRCVHCGLYSCSVRCIGVHHESRCV